MTTDSFLHPVQRESTAEVVANRVRNAISHSQIPQGKQLVESELAAELGVSRGPLREALQRLSQEGLLTAVRNRGLFVVSFTNEDVQDIYLARTAVELTAAEQLLRLDDREGMAQLLQIAKKVRVDNDAANDDRLRMEPDFVFHKTLVALSASKRLARIHDTLIAETRMCLSTMQKSYQVPSERVADHIEIAEALRDGDSRRVHELITLHMKDSEERLLHAQQYS